ncbi:MAG: translocation/assembly module TamB [Bacteroidales bacterium]|nr:translocation/assembly module TamB [Bacteroidales bacterium]
MAALTVVIGFILLVMLIVSFSFSQTYISKKITSYISREINSQITLDKIKFTFFNRLTAKNILIRDQNLDTLLFLPQLTATIKKLDIKNQDIRLGKVVALKPSFFLITDSLGLMNVNWYLNMLKKEEKKSKPGKFTMRMGRAEVIDGKFCQIKMIRPEPKTRMDYRNIRISGIDFAMNDFFVQGDSVYMEIDGVKMKEQSGFGIRDMKSKLSVYKKKIVFTDAIIECDSSEINAPLIAVLGDSITGFKNFNNKAIFDIKITQSAISGQDLKYFIPVKEMPENTFGFEGEVKGTVSELRGRKIRIKGMDKTDIYMNFALSGLPDIKNTFIFCEINSLKTSANDLMLIRIPEGKILTLPENIRKIENITFTGSFTGFINDFVTYGKLFTPYGSVSTDISLRPEGSKIFTIKGSVKGTGINIGELSGNRTLLGQSTITADIDGKTESFKTFAVNVAGIIDSIEINNYKYEKIKLAGYFTDKTWDGTIKAEDENLKMDLSGMFDFREELPEFDFTLDIKKADLFKLNIDKTDSTSALALLVTANFKGNNIDNLDGEIRLHNSDFRKYGNNLKVNEFLLKTFSENNSRILTLNTDFLTTEIKGRYNFSSIINDFKNVLAAMFPSKYNNFSIKPYHTANSFNFLINFRKTEELNKFLKTGLTISDKSTVKGIIKPDSLIYITGEAKYFGVKNNILDKLSFEAHYSDSLLNASVKTSSFNLMNIAELKNFYINFSTFPDHFRTNIEWIENENESHKGFFEATGEFVPLSGSKKEYAGALMKLNILPGEVYVKNNPWKINPAEIVADSNSIKISRFIINNNDNYFLTEGAASEDKMDTIYFKLNGIDIDVLNELIKKDTLSKPGKIELGLGGILGGTISLTDVYKNLMFESDVKIRDFKILESNYGDVKISSVWNKTKNIVDIEINNNLDGKKMFDVNGYYNPETKFVDLNIKTDKLPMEIMNPIAKTFATGITGTATGAVRFFGEFKKPFVTGTLFAENGTMKINFLQVKYIFSDSVKFDKDAIRFKNLVFKDENGNSGTLNGAVYHKYFKDFSPDLNITINNCLVLNTKSKDNEFFYGTASASGIVNIKPIDPVLKFDISINTGRNSRFYFPLTKGKSLTEKSFITFVAPTESDSSETFQQKKIAISKKQGKPIELLIDLEVTPDAEIQLLIDPKAGDIMKASGRGNLNISLDRKGIFKIFGDYIIENGDYLFTLGNIINKSFSVENGGKISFNGDINDADIDIKAIYKTRASLYDIMPGILPESQQNERIPVECLLVLTGKLFNPVVGFDINLPTADEETKAYLRSMIKSDEEMSRQFLFLLVMNRFYADPTLGTQAKTADIGSTTVGVTTMEMLSNQLSNWLSQISKDFDIGIYYRPEFQSLPNSNELQVALSTQLLNDRVTINGNFDVAGNQAQGRIGTSKTNNITGDFEIEYKLSEHLRFKFFNRSIDNIYIDNSVQYTQGIGLFYRHDFNSLKDLFSKKEKESGKKEEETNMVNK